MSDFPYEYGSDLHWLWGWWHRLDAYLQDDRPPSRLTCTVFRPDRLAADAMLHFETKHREAVAQMREHLDYVERQWTSFEASGFKPDRDAASDLIDAMLDLAGRIDVAVKTIATGDAEPDGKPSKMVGLRVVCEAFGMKPKAVKGFCARHEITTKQERRRFYVAVVPFFVAFAQDTNVRTDGALRKRAARLIGQQEILAKLDDATRQFFGA